MSRPLATCLVLAWLAVPLAAQPVITLGVDSVTVDAVTPGGSVATVGVNRTVASLVPATSTLGALTTEGAGSGSISWQLAEEISSQSFWAALDSSTAALALAWPAELDLEELDLDPAENLVAGPAGPASRLEVPLPRLSFFLLRPGGGAWKLVATDGGPEDLGEEADDAVSLDLSQAAALDGSGATLDGALPGDYLVGCSLRDLAYFAIEVTS